VPVRGLVSPGAALVAACVLTGCGAGTEQAPSAAAGGSNTTTSQASSAGNERVLSAKDSARLVAWLRRFQSCLREHGVESEAIVVTRRELSLRVRTQLSMGSLVSRSLPCGDALGDPPADSSLQVRPGDNRVVLYLPKRCLLDPKVAQRGA
jgi:hypothetical protein